MPPKGINGRANMQKFQMNSKKYGGNPFKYASLVSSVGRASKGGMWNSIQRRADHYDAAKKTTNVAPPAKPQLVTAQGVVTEFEGIYILLTFDMALFEPTNISINNFEVKNITQAGIPVPVNNLNGSGDKTVRLNLDTMHVVGGNEVQVVYNAEHIQKIKASNNEEADPFTTVQFQMGAGGMP